MLAHAVLYSSVTPKCGSVRSLTHTIVLALVWVAFASSGLVFSEPCPTDLLAMGLMVLLPLLGLVYISPVLALASLVWFAIGAAALVANMASSAIGASSIHTVVSLYLYGWAMVVSGFVAFRPEQHLRLIFNAWTVAAMVAAFCGIFGYFGVLPASDLFTKFDRATGTFKDPNVFGPFLVPALLYVLHIALHRPLHKAIPQLLIAAFLTAGVLLSFSRGAWMNLALSAGLYLALLFVTTEHNDLRRRIIALSLAGVAALALIIAAALQYEPVAELAAQRASADQSYDLGPEGRFGGQQKAANLILSHPFGLGAQEFARSYHHEEPHNVYLNMFLNAGWGGGTLYIIMVLGTCLIGLRTAFRRIPAQPILLIAVATFIANAAEGVIIDTDHWRHFYILSAIIWGIATQKQTAAALRPGSHQAAATTRARQWQTL